MSEHVGFHHENSLYQTALYTNEQKCALRCDLHVCYRRIKLNCVTELMQCTVHAAIGRRRVSHVDAVRLAGSL